MTIQFTDSDDLTPRMHERWLTLWRGSPDSHPFNHPGWYDAAVVKPPKASRRFIMVSKNGRDVMACAYQKYGRQWCLLGSPYLERSSLVLDADLTSSDWNAILEYLLSRYNQVMLQEIPRSVSDTLGALPLAARHISVRSSSSPYFPIDDPALSSKRRHELRRYSRKLDREHGPISFEFTPLRRRHLALMMDIEGRSTKPKRGRAAFDLPDFDQFMRQMIENYDEMCWIGIMRLNDHPVAHYAGVTGKHQMVGLHMAFDTTYYRCSPGGVLIYNLFPYLEKAGIRIFDFGRGASVLKSKFCGTRAKVQNTDFFFRKNPAGTVAWIKTRMVWRGIAMGRYLRTLENRRLNLVLDHFSIKR